MPGDRTPLLSQEALDKLGHMGSAGDVGMGIDKAKQWGRGSRQQRDRGGE